MLAHKAEDEGVAVAEILAGKAGHVNYDTIPSVIYTWPEMASVGITEEQVKERGLDYRSASSPSSPTAGPRRWTRPRAWSRSSPTRRPTASWASTSSARGRRDLIAEAVTTMEFAGSAEDIARICHAHPTLSEAVKEAALAVDKRAIHF